MVIIFLERAIPSFTYISGGWSLLRPIFRSSVKAFLSRKWPASYSTDLACSNRKLIVLRPWVWARKQKEILEDSQPPSQNSINGFRLGQEHKIELEDTPVLSCLTQFVLIILLKLYLCPEWRRIEARPGLGIVSVSHFEHISRSVTFHFRPMITLFHAQAPPKSASPAEISSPHCPSPCSPPTFLRLPSSGL